MDAIFIIRLLLIIVLVVIIDLIIKLNRTFRIDRRVSRYSIDSIIDDNNDISSIIKKKYNHIMKKVRGNFTKVDLLNNQSLKYSRYVSVGETKDLIDFIVIKLFLGICFVSLIIISLSIQGRIISFFWMIISFIIGYYLYDVYLYSSYKRKLNKIKNDMLRAVIIMNNAFKAGKSVLQSVEIVSNELPKPISIEFRRIYQDLVFGLSSEVAFNRFAKRVNLEEVRYLSSSLTILNRTGGNIINVFNSIEKTLIDKKKMEADLNNSTKASKFITIILTIIPVAFIFVIVKFLSPSYFDPFFESVFGYFMLSVICIMFSIYVYLLIKVMKVKV